MEHLPFFFFFWLQGICSPNLMPPSGNLRNYYCFRVRLGGRVCFLVKKQGGKILSLLSRVTSRKWAGKLNLAKSTFYPLPLILNCRWKSGRNMGEDIYSNCVGRTEICWRLLLLLFLFGSLEVPCVLPIPETNLPGSYLFFELPSIYTSVFSQYIPFCLS